MPKITSEEALADKPPVYVRQIYSDYDLSEFHKFITREQLTKEKWLEREKAVRYEKTISPVPNVGVVYRMVVIVEVTEWQGRFTQEMQTIAVQ
jgi:hypothetical protein